MSSTYNSTSASVDAHSSRELVDDLEPNNTDQFGNHLLSPYNHSQTLSNSASPSYNIIDTPGESLSEYSNYQPSDISEINNDPFFGVDFDAGVQRIDSIQSTLGNGYQSAELSRTVPEPHPQVENDLSSETYTVSTYPLSPIHSSIPNTPSPRGVTNDLKSKTTISQHELTTGLHNSRFQTITSLAPANPTTIQLTPDQSGSSHTSAEGLEPSIMNRLEQSPRVTISQWGSVQQHSQPNVPGQPNHHQHASSANEFGGYLPDQTAARGSEVLASRDEDGLWKRNVATGQGGLDPETRKELSNEELPSLKQQEEQRRIDIKNMEVQEWRSQAGGSSDAEEEPSDQSYFPITNTMWDQNQGPGTRQTHPEEDNDIAPVDDAVSIHENRLVEGQVYYHPKDGAFNNADVQLMSQSRHWSDSPTVPQIMTTLFQQPESSSEAMRRWNANADAFSIASRAATWGTRRRSEPSLADWESVADGSFLKRLSITKSKDEGRPRQNSSIFDQGLDRLANIVRKRSDSKLKRARSTQNIPAEAQNMPHPRNNSQGTLAPPPHTPSFGPKPTTNINTAFAAMAGPLVAVGTSHARSGSVSATATSPKSPLHLGFARSVIKRARSRSELTSHERAAQTGIAGLWRGQGGPPVANLSSPPIETEVKQPELQDHDEDDDDDDEQGDEGEFKIESEQEADPIVPNYEGFKAHVRRLNPDMDTRYNWLVSRIAHQQEIRYKNLLDLRVKHSQAINSRTCSAGRHCVAQGGNATLLDAKGDPRDSERNPAGLQLVTDFSDDSNPGEGALTDETFPSGVPMPPTRNLPAEFECQLCFKAKKFQKPSDWTKHVHEDVQPFTCTYDKCKEPKSFKRKADWVRHENERHRHLEWWICQVDDCRHPCYRKDNFLQHLVREHKLPEPKQKTKAAIKKARLTEPAWMMLERCHHETTSRPQDEPCKFCGKSFATWKKLTVHLAKHMEHISLPILRLVEVRNVDAHTIISPVEQILTPVTPISGTKMESNSPFNMNSISPYVPLGASRSKPIGTNFPQSTFDQRNYYPTSSASTGYGMQAPMPQEVPYNQNNMYANNFDVHQMGQPGGFNSIESNNIGHMDQSRAFGSMDSNFSQPKVEQTRGFGSMDSSFSHGMPDPNYDSHPNPPYSMPHNFSGPPAVSGYQNSNMLGISDAGYDFGMTVHAGQSFQQVPMSRAPGSASSYEHSPQNVPYYGHQ
jgi:hypothetical protein